MQRRQIAATAHAHANVNLTCAAKISADLSYLALKVGFIFKRVNNLTVVDLLITAVTVATKKSAATHNK